jgi:hypothetical protein
LAGIICDSLIHLVQNLLELLSSAPALLPSALVYSPKSVSPPVTASDVASLCPLVLSKEVDFTIDASRLDGIKFYQNSDILPLFQHQYFSAMVER